MNSNINNPHSNQKRNFAKFLLFSFIFGTYNLLCSISLFAQDGNSGIQEATNKVKGYFDSGCDLMYAIGAVVGVIGAIKVLCAMN